MGKVKVIDGLLIGCPEVKKGKNVTYYHMYSRACEKEENLAVWEEILGSVEVK